MADDATMLLIDARQEAGHILEDDEGNVEGITEAHETGRFFTGIDVQYPGQDHWLIGHNAHRVTA